MLPLNLRDPDGAEPAPVTTATPGVLRLYACVHGPRTALLTDLVHRVGEYHRLRVHQVRRGELAAAGPLNVRPAEVTLAGAGCQGPDGPADLVVDTGAAGGLGWPVRTVLAGPEPDVDLDALAGAGVEALAVRLVLLGTGYREPAALDLPAVAAAGTRLRRWRAAVAEWAESPSRPASTDHVRAVVTAFADDLDTPRALALLDELVADTGLPPGCKFETAAHLDRLYGLELAAEVGKSRTGGAGN